MNDERKKGSRFKPIHFSFIVLVSFLIFLGIYYNRDNSVDNPENDNNINDNQNDNEGDNNDDGLEANTEFFFNSRESIAYGTVQIEGYATIQEVIDCSYDDSECFENDNPPKLDYLIFNILKVDDENFKRWIESMSGNSFVSGDGIGLGCVSDGKLYYYNNSDEKGTQSITLTQADTAKIVNSTRNNPITLELERLKLSFGSGAPVCYSHITMIKIP